MKPLLFNATNHHILLWNTVNMNDYIAIRSRVLPASNTSIKPLKSTLCQVWKHSSIPKPAMTALCSSSAAANRCWPLTMEKAHLWLDGGDMSNDRNVISTLIAIEIISFCTSSRNLDLFRHDIGIKRYTECIKMNSSITYSQEQTQPISCF